MSTAPFREVALTQTGVSVEQRADGAILYRCDEELAAHPPSVMQRLAELAQKIPMQSLFAERAADGGWQHLSYADALAAARRIGAALLVRGLSAERPVAILSENSLDHAMLALACQYVGIAYSPVSPPYSLVSQDFGKLKHVIHLLTPGLVFAADARYAKAIAAAVPIDCEVVLGAGELPGRASTPFAALRHADTAAADLTFGKLQPETIAKFLFTSGSTKDPKAVINTHGMLAANQQMILQSLPFLAQTPPVLVDWLPWGHTFGGNHNVGIALYNGGTLYIDQGKPVPGAMQKTLANLKEIAPTMYFNVPKGFDELARALETDQALAQRFFSRLQLLFYAGSSLPQPLWDQLDRLAVRTTGTRVAMITGFGMTETAPACLSPNRPDIKAGMVGIPLPGLRVKLVPTGDKLEIRHAGGHVTPGYWRMPQETQEAFDAEGYFCTGDALKFVDAANPGLGLVFDGRIAEDFKLLTGTFVSVGPLRARAITAFAPYVQDVVVAGHDRDELGLLLIPNIDALKTLVQQSSSGAMPEDERPEALFRHASVKPAMLAALQALHDSGTGSATRPTRALMLHVPPSIDKGEITDKGSINQRVMLRERAAEVARLYATTANAAAAAAASSADSDLLTISTTQS